MHTLTQEAYKLHPPMGLFDETVVTNLFPRRTGGARKALVHRAVSSGQVLRLKPGLFCLAAPWRRATVHPFVLASVLLSPSHVSLESALWHHGLIPEGLRAVASVTSLRSRTFRTALGAFTYATVPTRYPRAGVRCVEIARDSWAFVATPLRALADLVYSRREVCWRTDGLAWLTDSLRIERDELLALPVDDADEVLGSIQSVRTTTYLTGLLRELGR